jgi:hypothetical protein
MKIIYNTKNDRVIYITRDDNAEVIITHDIIIIPREVNIPFKGLPSDVAIATDVNLPENFNADAYLFDGINWTIDVNWTMPPIEDE